MKYPASIQNLIDLFIRFPSVGPRTAERYVFYLLKHNPEYLQKLAQAIAELKENTVTCKTCLAISETDPCRICQDKSRNKDLLCVVSNTRDMLIIESTKQFNGYYHILGGVLSAVKGIKPEQLNIKQLVDRLKNNAFKEAILAFSPNIDGETTAMYLAKLLAGYKLKISRLAKGLPMGAELEYADDITLSNALKYRNFIK